MSKISIAFLKEKTDTECRELAGHYYRRARRAEKERDQLREQVEALSRDAERYRALRSMHWYDSPLAVACNPKVAIKPGHDCPSGERLDAAIDAAIDACRKQGGEL